MDTATEYGQKEFTLPHDVIKLPSGGIFYKSKKKSIKVGYLTASDENLLMAGDNIPKEGIIMNLLRNKIYEPDFRPEELLQGDIEAILIFLRNTAFGPEYSVTITDPDTSKPFQSTVMLDELFIKSPKSTPNENGFFEVKLPKSGLSVKVKPLSYGEMEEIERLVESYPPGRIAPKQTMKLNKMILEIEGQSDKSMISQQIENLPISDAKFLRTFIEENEPRLDLTKKVRTPSGKETTINIVFGVEFFRPFF